MTQVSIESHETFDAIDADLDVPRTHALLHHHHRRRLQNRCRTRMTLPIAETVGICGRMGRQSAIGPTHVRLALTYSGIYELADAEAGKGRISSQA